MTEVGDRGQRSEVAALSCQRPRARSVTSDRPYRRARQRRPQDGPVGHQRAEDQLALRAAGRDASVTGAVSFPA
jgi:hypothetical protein